METKQKVTPINETEENSISKTEESKSLTASSASIKQPKAMKLVPTSPQVKPYLRVNTRENTVGSMSNFLVDQTVYEKQ